MVFKQNISRKSDLHSQLYTFLKMDHASYVYRQVNKANIKFGQDSIFLHHSSILISIIISGCMFFSGARMLYKNLPRNVGLRRLTLHKSATGPNVNYILLVECSHFLDNINQVDTDFLKGVGVWTMIRLVFGSYLISTDNTSSLWNRLPLLFVSQ